MRLKNFRLDLLGWITKLEVGEVEEVELEVVEDIEVVGATVMLLLTKGSVVVVVVVLVVGIFEIGSTSIGSIVIGWTVTTVLVDLIG